MSDKSKGLYQKYFVERVDGKEIKDGCIVLEFGDHLSRFGIMAFAEAVHEQYPKLSIEIKEKLSKYVC